MRFLVVAPCAVGLIGLLAVVPAFAAGPLVLRPVALLDASNAPADDAAVQKVTAAIEKTGAVLDASAPEPKPPVRPMPADLVEIDRRARDATEQMDTPTAIRAWRDLVDGIESRLVSVGNVDLLVEARLQLAAIYLATKEDALARAELDAAARLRPSTVLDLSRFSPIVAEAFDQARARVMQESGAQIDVAVTPDGADVFVDGARVGQTPMAVQVRRGVHYVWIGKRGHAPIEQARNVTAGAKDAITGALVEDPGFALRARLARELAGEDRREEALGLLDAVARDSKTNVVVASGVLPISGGYAVLLATNGDGKGRARTAAVTLDPALAGASGALTQALAGLTAAEGRDDVRVRGDHAPDADDLELDHDRYLLGVTHREASGPVATTTAQEGDDEGISPWVFAGVGAGLVGAASIAGLIVTAIVFLQPAPPADRVQKPDETHVTFEVAP